MCRFNFFAYYNFPLLYRIIIGASLVIIFTLFSESFGFDLKCSNTVRDDNCVEDCIPLLHRFGTCSVYDLEITSPDDTITSVNGETEPYFNYKRLLINNQKVSFVPRNIANFFPQLTTLEISNSSLEWIEQEDIRDLKNLKILNLEKNSIEILEKDLFDFNTKLETINISENRLQFLHKGIFYKLGGLRSIDLKQNNCTESFYNNYRNYFQDAYNYRTIVQEQLGHYCQSWEDAYRIYERKFNKKINDLQSEKDKLTHRLRACDGNLDSALTNFRQLTFVNKNIELVDKPNDSLVINLTCQDEQCIAIDFKVSRDNLSIESENYKSLIIRSLKIQQQQTLFLPQNLAEHFPLLNELLVVESGLYEIDYSVLDGLDLFTLNLTNNKIPAIPVDTFADLENLQELDLSFNKLHTLHDDVFANLKSLQKLYLNNNFLTSMKVEVLRSLGSLSGLFLGNNRLKFISATLLTPLTSLETVDLSANACIDMDHPTSSLIDIETTIIDNCIAPVEVNCKIETNKNAKNCCTAEDLFIEYPKTKISKLNGVQGLNNTVQHFLADKQSIKFFPFQLSQQFPNLERIEIQKSGLIALHGMDFDGFSKLVEIVMNGNNLSSISRGTFDAIPQLELLDLSSNNIVSLPSRIFTSLTRLHTLLLSNNRIVRFVADILPRRNVIDAMRLDNNQLEFIETKTIRFLRKAKIIDLTRNVCIDMKIAKTENSTRAFMELSGEIDLNCSADD